jgi:DNA mismatch repair ATPase MutL
MAATANSPKEKKLLSIAGKKTVKNKKKKTAGLARRTNETKKQWAKAKKIAEVTKELKKALEKEETKTPEKKQELPKETILENPEKKEETEEPQEENQEPQEETEESSQKETFDWEKRQKELIGETFSENPEKKEETEEPQEENQEPLEEKTSETLEKMELSEESEEEPFFKEEEETTNISEETLASMPEKNTKEYNDEDISLQYPNWKESKEKSADSLLAVAQPPFRFELSKTEIFNQTIQKFVSSKTEKIQSKPGSKILIQKETSNNIFIEYSEETMGEKFLSKALFILHKNNAYSIIFTAPSDQFQKIDDLFLKTIFSVQTY